MEAGGQRGQTLHYLPCHPETAHQDDPVWHMAAFQMFPFSNRNEMQTKGERELN